MRRIICAIISIVFFLNTAVSNLVLAQGLNIPNSSSLRPPLLSGDFGNAKAKKMAAFDSATKNLASLSEDEYQRYLETLSKTPFEFHNDGLPNLPKNMKFMIELRALIETNYGQGFSSHPACTARLLEGLERYIQTLIKEKKLKKGWGIESENDIRSPNDMIRINTPNLSNNKESFIELKKGLSEIKQFIVTQKYDAKYRISQTMHIEISHPKLKKDAYLFMKALAFIGKSMEYYWARLIQKEKTEEYFWKKIYYLEKRGLLGDTYQDRPFFYNINTGTCDFNLFTPVDFSDDYYFEKLQMTLGVAMNIVNSALNRPDKFNIIDWGLPVSLSAPYSTENSYILRKALDELYENNNIGKISFLRLLISLSKRPYYEEDYKKYTKDLPGQPLEDFYGSYGLRLIYEIHSKNRGWSDNTRKDIMDSLATAGNKDEFRDLCNAILNLIDCKSPLVPFLGCLMAELKNKGIINEEYFEKSLFIKEPYAFFGEKPQISPDGKLACMTRDCTKRDPFKGITSKVVLYDLATGRELRAFPGLSGRFSPDSKTIWVELGGSSTKYDVETGKKLGDFNGMDPVFSPDGKTVALEDTIDSSVLLYDDIASKRTHSLGGYNPVFSTDGERIACMEESKSIPAKYYIIVYEVNSKEKLNVFMGDEAVFSNRTTIWIQKDNKITAYDISTSPIKRLCSFTGDDFVLSPDGTTIWIQTKDKITAYDISTKSEHQTFTGMDFVFSPDNKKICMWQNGKTVIGDVNTQERLYTFNGENPVFPKDINKVFLQIGSGQVKLLTLKTLKNLLYPDQPDPGLTILEKKKSNNRFI